MSTLPKCLGALRTRVWNVSGHFGPGPKVSHAFSDNTQFLGTLWTILCLTRKPCYRKDDRAMRPIYGCTEKFRESSQTLLATFPEICKGLLFWSILRTCIQNLKFVALSVPEIIGGTQKIWVVPRYAHAPFSLKFLKGFCSDGPCEYTCQIWSS